MGAEGGKEKEKQVRQTVTVEEVEALLSKLPGVLSSRVVVNDWGGVEEIHILATCERHPKQIVRNVESALAARWALHVDHKKISVAQLEEIPPSSLHQRFKLSQLESYAHTAQRRLQIKVRLGGPGEGEELEGLAEGPLTPGSARRIAAEAVLTALAPVLKPGVSLSVENVGSFRLGPYEAVAVLVNVLDPRGRPEPLLGAVLAEDDPAYDAVRATLDALNRRLGILAGRVPRKG